MDRISTSNRDQNLFGAGKDGFRNGDLALGTEPTAFDAPWCNGVQEELLNVIEAAGLTPTPASYSQVLEAIRRMIDIQSGNYLLDTGAANAYVVAVDPAIVAYTDGMTVRFRFTNANTSASTLNAGGGVVPLLNDVGDALLAGDAPAGGIASVTYDATANAFLINSLVPSQAMSQTAADVRYAPILSGKYPGEIFDFAGPVAPPGSLECPLAPGGSQIQPIALYPALYASIGVAWGGDGVTTFGIPYFPAGYASVQANANIGSETVGEVIAHTHVQTVYSAAASGGNIPVGFSSTAGDVSGPYSTQSTGGAANFAAGMRVMKCVKY
jgi:microcystin-dependent protein